MAATIAQAREDFTPSERWQCDHVWSGEELAYGEIHPAPLACMGIAE
ncbi:hypothetical protein R3Q06_34335 [Rhodococcus erythropolis]|nr:hypothetical protein [Rhodococcus erythropolis]MDV6278489.1 hypothetical protein [Rhodococcus erythropolis]